MGADREGMPRNGFRRNGNGKNAVILVIIELITQGNETILDNYKEISAYSEYLMGQTVCLKPLYGIFQPRCIRLSFMLRNNSKGHCNEYQ